MSAPDESGPPASPAGPAGPTGSGPDLAAAETPSGPGVEVEKRETVREDIGLAPERRNERQFVRVQLPMEVEHGGAVYPGRDLSLNGFSCVGTPAVAEDVTDDYVIRLLFHGYTLGVPLKAARVRQIEGQDLSGFQIVEIADAQVEVLRKVLRAHLAGQLVTIDGLLVSADSQTARRAGTPGGNDADLRLSGLARWRRRAWYLAVAGATCALVLMLAASLFERFAMIEAAFAAVTAPKLDVRAPTGGQIGPHGLRPGDRVGRDQPLARVLDRALDAELEIARARLATAERLLGEVQLEPERPRASFPLPPPFASAAPQAATVSGSERRAALAATSGLERARVHALEHRLRGNQLHAACDCVVFWAVPTGEWVQKGDLLFTLMRAGGDDLLIEALVPLRVIDRIGQDQAAFVALPDHARLIEARVALVALDPQRQPRAGFPRWLQQDRTLGSVLLRPAQPLPPALIGRPVEVVFSDLPAATVALANARAHLAELGARALAATLRAPALMRAFTTAAVDLIGGAIAGESE